MESDVVKPGPKHPGGRPKGRKNDRTLDGEQLAREILESHDVKKAIRELLNCDDRTIKLRTTEFLFAYAYGKPRQRTELTGAEGQAVKILLDVTTSDVEGDKGDD